MNGVSDPFSTIIVIWTDKEWSCKYIINLLVPGIIANYARQLRWTICHQRISNWHGIVELYIAFIYQTPCTLIVSVCVPQHNSSVSHLEFL